MSSLEFGEVAINLKLFKLFRFYHLFDPNSENICKFNVYHLAWYILNCVVGCIIIYASLGCFTGTENVIDIILNNAQYQTVLLFQLLSRLT